MIKKPALGAAALLLLVWLSTPARPAGRQTVPPPAAKPAAEAQLPAAETSPADNLAFEEAARFVSGLTCESRAFQRLQEAPEWKSYAEAIAKAWADLEDRRLKPMREWAAAALLDSRAATRTLFYPFGGPDFLTAFTLYPGVEAFVLGGLEPVGRLPEFRTFTPVQAAAYLQTLNGALWDFLNKSYFVTRTMSAALSGDKVNGVLPILCLFLKRTGNDIVSIRRCEIKDDGTLWEMDFFARRRAIQPYGVRIDFMPADGIRTRTLYYFSADLSDGPFGPKSRFHRFLAALPFETAFVKSASYLMHYTFFSSIRGLLLGKSRWILEDDTGIPYKYFLPESWEARFFGEYVKPVELFRGVEQDDLKKAFAAAAPVQALPFHLGYHWSTNKDSLLYFQRKAATAPENR